MFSLSRLDCSSHTTHTHTFLPLSYLLSAAPPRSFEEIPIYTQSCLSGHRQQAARAKGASRELAFSRALPWPFGQVPPCSVALCTPRACSRTLLHRPRAALLSEQLQENQAEELQPGAQAVLLGVPQQNSKLSVC